MESMTNSTWQIKKYHAESLYQNPATNESLFSFVTSIARTNLESEIIQRGGSLCTHNNIRYRPKRECIVPLLHVLSFHVKFLLSNKNLSFTTHEWKMDRIWASLCGITMTDDETPITKYTYEDNVEIPILITDPSAQLIKFLLLAPIQLDQGRLQLKLNLINIYPRFCFAAYFTCIVKTMFNLLYYQIVLQFCTRMTDEEVSEVIEKYSEARVVPHNGVGHIGIAMALVLNNLDRCESFRNKKDNSPSYADDSSRMDADDDDQNNDVEMSDATNLPKASIKAVDLESKLKDYENELQSLCLPFLRNAALLRHHVYHHEMPDIKDEEKEFARLVYFLELVTKSMDWKDFNATKALNFAKGLETSLPIRWCVGLKESRPPHDTTSELIQSQHTAWHQPQLLALPREYERLFTV